jgi:hypothetical protein
MYTDPKDVTSPQVSVSKVRPVLDAGEWDYSVALLQWEKQPAVGIRWNGGSEEGEKIQPGNPQSRGLPIWFIVPEPFELAILETVLARGCGGGSINATEAEAAVNEAVSRIKSKSPATPGPITEDELEARIVKVVRKMQEQGLIKVQ